MHFNVVPFSGAFPISYSYIRFVVASIFITFVSCLSVSFLMYLQCNNNFSIFFLQLIDSFVMTVSLSHCLIVSYSYNNEEFIAAKVKIQSGKQLLNPINDHKANSIR